MSSSQIKLPSSTGREYPFDEQKERTPFINRTPPYASSPLKPTWKQFLQTWIFIFCAIIWISFTIFFAYNSTLTNPFSKSLLLSKPSRTITALTVMSHITVLWLQMITSTVFEAVRWTYASSTEGISAFAFIALSRATGIPGIVKLLFHDSKTNQGFAKGHRLWGVQRSDVYQPF